MTAIEDNARINQRRRCVGGPSRVANERLWMGSLSPRSSNEHRRR